MARSCPYKQQINLAHFSGLYNYKWGKNHLKFFKLCFQASASFGCLPASLHLWNSLPDALFPENKEYQKASIIILIVGYLNQTAGDINYEKTYKPVSDEE